MRPKPNAELQPFLSTMAASPVVAELCRRLVEQKYVAATGQWGSCALVLAAIAQQKLNRPFLILTAHLDESDDAIDQLAFFRPGVDARLYPAFEVLPGESNISHELAAQRLELLVDLAKPLTAENPAPQFLVAPIQSLMQPSPGKELLKDLVLTLRVGQT